MRNPVALENIEEMRRQEGIDDAELRQEIGGLAPGDCVKLTLLSTAKSAETLLVRITSIRGQEFRGKLAHRPASFDLAGLPVGTSLVFTRAHIHSLPKKQSLHDQ